MKQALCVLLLLLLVGCTSSDSESLAPTDDKLSLPRQESSMLYGEVVNSLSNVLAQEDAEAQADLEKWQKVNEDVCYMLSVPNLEIYEPVVAATLNNKQWLRTNIYGEPDVAGCVFLDHRCNPELISVKLIHGHNMKNGSRFGALPTLLDISDCSEAPAINLYTNDGWLPYEVFSVLSVDSIKEALPIDLFFDSEDVSMVADDLLSRSLVPGGNIQSDDILILNTCWYGESGREHNLHCIVVASRTGVGGS